MKGMELSKKEMRSLVPGEAITLSAVLAVLAIAIVAIVCYRLFMAHTGSAKLPGGWAFEWK